MDILLGGGPSWADILTAVGTAVLAVFAIVTTGFAAAAFRAQSSQLRSEQGERAREAEERRRAQAVQVYVWQTPPVTDGTPPETSRTAFLVNSSQQPVYDVTIRWMTGGILRGASVREEPLKPGEEQTAVTSSDTDTDLDGVVAVAFFRDRAGLQWRTYADGRLEQDDPAPAATAFGSSAR